MLAALTLHSFVLWIHISAVVVAFGATFAYPVLLAQARRAQPAQRAFFHRAQEKIGQRILAPGLLVVLLAGAYLATEEGVWSELWVSIPLLIVIVIGGLGGAFLAPKERRLAELAEAGEGTEYQRVLGQVTVATYVAMALVLVAAFFMITKVG